LIQKKIQKKSDFVVKGFINDLPKLEYFFEKFFESMPKLKHTLKVTNPKTKKENTIELEGLSDFFA